MVPSLGASMPGVTHPPHPNIDFIGPIKQNHSGYPKDFIASTMQSWAAGSHLVIHTEVEGKDLYAIGYKYCSSMTLMFIMTASAGHTEPGEPYIGKWIDANGNHCKREILRPQAIAHFFGFSNLIDSHNKVRQKDLRLKKCWVTENGFF